jgi:hypothetical protein
VPSGQRSVDAILPKRSARIPERPPQAPSKETQRIKSTRDEVFLVIVSCRIGRRTGRPVVDLRRLRLVMASLERRLGMADHFHSRRARLAGVAGSTWYLFLEPVIDLCADGVACWVDENDTEVVFERYASESFDVRSARTWCGTSMAWPSLDCDWRMAPLFRSKTRTGTLTCTLVTSRGGRGARGSRTRTLPATSFVRPSCVMARTCT